MLLTDVENFNFNFNYYSISFASEMLAESLAMSKVYFRTMLATSPDHNGRYPVMIRITFNRTPTKRATPFAAAKSETCIRDRKLELRKGSKTALLLDAFINDLSHAAQKIDLSCLGKTTPGQLYNRLLDEVIAAKKVEMAKDSFTLDFPTFAQTVISKKKGSTAKVYRQALKNFTCFMEQEHYDISSITSSTLKRFETYLIDKLGRYSKTIPLYFNDLRTIHRAAREEFNNPELGEVFIKDPFQYFRPAAKPLEIEVQPASRELIQYIIDEYQTFNTEETRAADLFLLIFALQGMNVADMMEAEAPKNGVIVFNRLKTQGRSSNKGETQVMIHPQIAPLYNKYKDPDGIYTFSFKSRYSSLQYLHVESSKWMKALRARIKLNPDLRDQADGLKYGSARHSYPTISRQMGIDKRLINDGMSHVDPEMKNTDRYIKIAWEPIWEANLKMLESFNWDGIK